MGEQEPVNVEPDTMVDKILTGLAAGKRREQLAAELNYKNYKSLDIYMKRRNYEWDAKRNYYFPAKEKPQLEDVMKLMNRPEGRAADVLSLVKSGVEMKEIALQLKFIDLRELALFMKSKGYAWNEKELTFSYVGKKNLQIELDAKLQLPEEAMEIKEFNETKQQKGDYAMAIAINESSMQVMNFLENHKEALFELVSSHVAAPKIPRYIVPGICTTKSIHMNYGLDQLIREFSQEKNISQKDIVEVALIDFFGRYGFQREINTLIGSNK